MENTNQYINDIYSSYGPIVGKACENTNKIFYNDLNFISPKQEIKLSDHAVEINNHTNIIQNDIIQNAGSNNAIIDEKSIQTISSPDGYVIFGYSLSLWTIILILIVVSCIIYFIYKYFFTKNELVTYLKLCQSLKKSFLQKTTIKVVDAEVPHFVDALNLFLL